jgi:protease I
VVQEEDMARVAFIVGDMFEDSELQVPYERVKDEGHEPVIIGTGAGQQLEGKKGMTITTEASIEDVSADDFAALVIPGGYSPDKIRANKGMVDFTRSIFEAGKPVAAICHAGWMLAEAGISAGKTLTSYHSIKTDLINAGANWIDQEVVEDQNLITSRTPDDLAAFTKTLLAQIGSA